MTEQQFESDKETFEFFMEGGKSMAAIHTLLETLVESKSPGSEWLDKTIILLQEGYIEKYPMPGYPVMRVLLLALARYFEVREAIPANEQKQIYGNLSWWLVQSESHFKWLVDEFAEDDGDLRWALRVVFRRYLRYKAEQPQNLKTTFLAEHLLTLIDPEFVKNDWSIFDKPAKENERIFVFQRPFRFCHPAQ